MRRFFLLIFCFSLLCPVRCVAEDVPTVALTFDDGPSGRFTRRLLEGLRQRQVCVTFLLCGYRLAEDPGLAAQMLQDGHEIGLHGYSHKNMAAMSRHAVAKELSDTLSLLPTGYRPNFFRPPGGAFSENTRQAARDAGLAILNWSVDPLDWKIHDTAAVEAAVLEQTRDGDVILLHDLCDCSVDAALAIIDKLQAQGFRFVTASQLARQKGITPQPGKVYRRFRPAVPATAGEAALPPDRSN